MIVIFCTKSLISLYSQIVVKEINFENSTHLKIGFYNYSADTIKITSLQVSSDTIVLSKDYQYLTILPYNQYYEDFKIDSTIHELKKVLVSITANQTPLQTNFTGYLSSGESALLTPEINPSTGKSGYITPAEFVICNKSETRDERSRYLKGPLVKKTTKTNFTPRDSSPNAALIYNDKYWIFGGWDYNEDSNTWSSKANVWNSDDGIDWTLINPNPPFTHYSSFLVFKDKIMVFNRDTAFVTVDGITWDQQRINPFWAFTRYITWNDKLYWFGWNLRGESEDGINWTIEPTNLPCDSIPELPAIVKTSTKLFMYGGTGMNKVWSSYDGLIWEKVLDKAPWQPRKWFDYTFFDNKMWMMEGNNEDPADSINFGNLKDFWYSYDGIKWVMLDTIPEFENRHGSFMWNDGNRVLISSGFGNNIRSRMHNDIWELNKSLSLTSNTSIFSQMLTPCAPVSDISYIVRGTSDVTVTGLPGGVKSNMTDGLLTISGVPSKPGNYNYEIILNDSLNQVGASGNITISADADLSLISDAGTDKQVFCLNNPLGNIQYNLTNAIGAQVIGLPDGVTGLLGNGVYTISGKPSLSGVFNYTITATSNCISPRLTGSITVLPETTISLASDPGSADQFLLVNTSMKEISYVTNASNEISVGGLPDGISFTYSEGVLNFSGRPNQTGVFNYKISSTGLCSSAETEGIININSYQIFPNPTTGGLTILNIGNFELKVYDLSGNLIFNKLYTDYYKVFQKDFSNILSEAGVYQFVITNRTTGLVSRQKIVFLH